MLKDLVKNNKRPSPSPEVLKALVDALRLKVSLLWPELKSHIGGAFDRRGFQLDPEDEPGVDASDRKIEQLQLSNIASASSNSLGRRTCNQRSRPPTAKPMISSRTPSSP